MRIEVAETAGFCFGVKRAVAMVEEQIRSHPEMKVYTYGPIIHNDTVVEHFRQQGVSVMEEDSDPASFEKGIVILRSHGVSKKVQAGIEAAGHLVVDATCPFVKKIHKLAMKAAEDGDYILIIGDRKHPEIVGICGWIEGYGYSVIETKEEAAAFSMEKKEARITVLAQTTFDHNKFQDIVEILKEKGYDINALNTICNATEERQNEAARIAGEVDVCLVIGGRNSSNTRKLYDICRQTCPKTYFLESADDLDARVLGSARIVGITAGASTPAEIIQEVISKCQI